MPSAWRGLGPSLQRCLPTLAPWLLAATVCLAFHRVCDAFFVQDDFWFLQEVQAPIPNALWWRGGLPDFLRPFSYWFPFVGWHLFGPVPTGYHVLQLVFFAAAVIVLQRVLARLTGTSLAAAFGTAVFGLSWIHLGPLGWLSGAVDTIALLSAFLLLHAALAHARGRGALALVVPICALALLTKEACAVLPLALVGYLAARCALARRRPTPRELQLAAALLATLLVYAVAWSLLVLPATEPGTLAIDFGRTVHVLCDSLGALWPIGGRDVTAATAWLLVPPLLAAVLPAAQRAETVLALLLWLLPAAVFGVTAKPVGLQPYYAEFSLGGLAVLVALVTAAALRWVPEHRRPLARAALLALLVGYAVVAVRADDRAVRRALAPSLHQARFSAAAHQAIRAALAGGTYRTLALLDLSDVMWWSIGKGAMVPLLFGLEVKIDGYDGCTIPPGTATQGDTLVLRQTGEMELAVVRE